ncbi:MAG: hypothetical protein COB05_17755 [Marinobacter sp.]|jgi:prefoldin subunit 5|nr:MAG: hypothetical protein COB05_17755 [Marinobacter sp.]
MKAKFCLLLTASVLLTGCGSSNVDAVKESAFLVDESFTVVQAMDSRPICADSSWEELEDDRGRVIVEYRCEFEGAEDYFAGSDSVTEDYISHTLAPAIEQEQRFIDELQSELDTAPQIIEEAINEFRAENELDSFMFVRYKVRPRENCGVSASSYSDGYSDEKADALRVCLEERVAKYEAEIEDRKAKIQELEQRIESKSRVADIQSATEVFKWTVTEEKIYYYGGGVALSFGDQSPLYFPYMEDGGRYGYAMKQALTDTLSDEFESYATLAETRKSVPSIRQVLAEL